MPDSTSTLQPINSIEEEMTTLDETASEETELEELDEELIIEDFTIDGICGVY